MALTLGYTGYSQSGMYASSLAELHA
jgi:hypothetical protein